MLIASMHGALEFHLMSTSHVNATTPTLTLFLKRSSSAWPATFPPPTLHRNVGSPINTAWLLLCTFKRCRRGN